MENDKSPRVAYLELNVELWKNPQYGEIKEAAARK